MLPAKKSEFSIISRSLPILYISIENKELRGDAAITAHDFPGYRRSCHRIFMSAEGRIASENPSLRVNGSEYAKTQGARTRGSGED